VRFLNLFLRIFRGNYFFYLLTCRTLPFFPLFFISSSQCKIVLSLYPLKWIDQSVPPDHQFCYFGTCFSPRRLLFFLCLSSRWVFCFSGCFSFLSPNFPDVSGSPLPPRQNQAFSFPSSLKECFYPSHPFPSGLKPFALPAQPLSLALFKPDQKVRFFSFPRFMLFASTPTIPGMQIPPTPGKRIFMSARVIPFPFLCCFSPMSCPPNLFSPDERPFVFLAKIIALPPR